MPLIRALTIIALAAPLPAAMCTTPPIDSFCVKLQRKDFTDPGLRAQNKRNKEADLVNERSWLRDCAGTPAPVIPSKGS